jgi:predicted nucleic acid-binding protein
VLVYAHRRDAPWHDRARACVGALAEGRSAWAVPWPCVHEFLSIVTHPRIYDPPSTLEQALAQVDAWCESPSLVLIAEDDEYWSALRHLLARARVAGPRIHDARVAALCRFADLTTRNPLIE